MKTQLIRQLTGTKTASLLLGFVVLGLFGEFAHQSEHDLTAQAEHCATCVHLDQTAQPGFATALVLAAPRPPAAVPKTMSGTDAGRRPSPFESRAPPA